MNTKTDEGLYEKARKLFISKASIRRLGHAPPGRRRPPPARHGTGEQGTREARQAPAPRPVPRRQGSRRLRLHERQAPRRLHAR